MTNQAMNSPDAPPSARDFHAQAYDELKAKRPERELWAQAIASSDGDSKRAISTYVRERARALQAHADAATPNPVNVWDHRQAPNLPAPAKERSQKGGIPSSLIWLAALGLWLIAFLVKQGPGPLFTTDMDWWLLARAESLGNTLGALLLGAAFGLVALGVNELVARLSREHALPRMRLFGVASVGAAYPLLLHSFGIV